MRNCGQGLLIGIGVAMAGFGQTAPSARSVEEQLAPLRQMILDNKLAEAERLVRRVLPTPEAEPKETGWPNLSAYNLTWEILVDRYLATNDYAGAERVASERLKLAEGAVPADRYRIQLFTLALGRTYLTEGKYAMAAPLYDRLLVADAYNQLSADFQVNAYVGMTEALMAQGRAAEAEQLLKPMVFVEGADLARRAAFHEAVFNTYAVVLKEAGRIAEAEEIVAEIGRETSRPEGFDAQDRDLLRARLLRARGSFNEAEAIYREWIKHWDDRPAEQGIRRELAEPRLKALQEYSDFLTLRQRLPEAQAARGRLRMLEREYNVGF